MSSDLSPASGSMHQSVRLEIIPLSELVAPWLRIPHIRGCGQGGSSVSFRFSRGDCKGGTIDLSGLGFLSMTSMLGPISDFASIVHSSSIIERREGRTLRGFGAGTPVGVPVRSRAHLDAIVRRVCRQYLEVR